MHSNNQKQIRAERYQGLVDAQNQNDDLRNVGDRIVLPPSIDLHVCSWYCRLLSCVAYCLCGWFGFVTIDFGRYGNST